MLKWNIKLIKLHNNLNSISMKKKLTLAVSLILFISFNIFSQSLMLTPGNQGKLNLPKLTFEQIQAITAPESGSIVYDLTTNCLRFYNGTKWICTDQKANDFSPTALNAWKVSELNPTSNFQCNHIAVDNQGNIFIAGIFKDNFKIGGITYTALGYADAFVVKYNSVGIAQWVKTGGYQDRYTYSSDIAVDNQGNVFLAGNFFNGLTFDSFTISANNNSGDIFLCKLSANTGNILALKSAGGSNYDTMGKIFVDNLSNVYMVGNFVGSCSFDGFTVTGIDNNDIYIAKCNSNLVFQWANKIEGVNADDGRGIYGDNNGNIYVTGFIASNATFAPGVTLSTGNQTMFVVKYNSTNGNYIWHRNQSNTGFSSYGHRIVTDNEGNIYVGGYFFNYMVLGGLQINGSGAASDLFIAKISASGDWQWVQQSFNTDYYDTEFFNDMKINSSNEIFILCKINSFSTFGFGNKRYLGHNFVFKLDKNGGIKGGNVFDSSNSYLGTIALNGNYHYVTGYFSGSISFGNLSLSSPTYNGFVAKFVD
jgi:hypothetical protein